MKRKLALIQLVLVLIFGVLIYISIENRKTMMIDWVEVTEEAYGLEVIEVYTETQFELNHYGEWDELGFDRLVFERFYEAPRETYPTALVNVSYVLTNLGERLIYSFPYIYQKQDPKDFVHIVDDVIPMTKNQIKASLGGHEDLIGVQIMIEQNEFHMVSPMGSFLNVYAELASIIGEKMQNVLFFESYDASVSFFIYNNQLYVVRWLGGTDLFELYPTYTNLAGFVQELETA